MTISIHDHRIRKVEVDALHHEIRILTIDSTAPDASAEVVFEGVEAYSFSGDALGTILFGIEATNSLALYREHAADMQRVYAASGAHAPWTRDDASAAAFLSSQEIRGYRVSSSIGLYGAIWARKTRIRRLEGGASGGLVDSVFLLWHVDDRADGEDAKLLGVYHSAGEAESAIARLKSKPGFVDVPSGFHIDEYKLDQDHWTEGFVIVDDQGQGRLTDTQPQQQKVALAMTLKKGLELLREEIGGGPPVRKHAFYRIKLRMWLHRGDPVRWDTPWGLLNDARLEEDRTVLITDVRVDRVFLFSGLFYGIQGMNVGGTRVLRIAPHLAYRREGLPGVIPPDAVLTAELSVLAENTESGLKGQQTAQEASE